MILTFDMPLFVEVKKFLRLNDAVEENVLVQNK